MQREKNDMMGQELDNMKRNMLAMTPRAAMLAQRASARNAEKKSFDFTPKENVKNDDGALNTKELEKLLLERTEELDELKEAFEALDAENNELRQQNVEM